MAKKTIILYFFILLKFVLQYFAIGPDYELHGDELLHLDLGNHLAWGYATVPPIIGWNSYLINHLGGSVFLIKFFPALFGALTIVVVWKTIEELKGNLFALILGAVSVTFSVLLAHNVFYQPNCLEILLWTLIFFAIIKFTNSEDNKWLWIVSISFAIGFLNKYNIVFLVLGLLPAILLTKHRKIFLNKHFYLSLLASIIIIFPNLLWQYNNDFPVFHHLQELTNEHLAKLSRWDFLVDQYFQFAGSFIVIILAFISFFRYAPFKKYTIFFWSYIFTISIYLYLNAKSYYTAGLYPFLIAFGAVYLEQSLRNGWQKYLRPIFILMPVLVVLYQLPLLVPFYSPERIKQSEMAKTYNGGELPSSFASMLGWCELAKLVDSAFDSIADKEKTLIHCEWYGQAGAINYYSKQDYTEAVAFHVDYINWFPLDEMEIRNVIFLKHSGDIDDIREEVESLFKTISLVGEVKNIYAQEYGTKVYILSGAKRSINEFIRKQIQERKDNR